MANDFEATYAALRAVFQPLEAKLHVLKESGIGCEFETLVASPFPQHKGKNMWFGAVKIGKAYVSFHLLPLYMNEKLSATVSPELSKRKQGKACFNFKSVPEPALMKELQALAKAGLKDFEAKKWA